jgi:hypothetical protein
MGLLDRLFGKRTKREDAPSAASPVQPQREKSTPSSLLEYLDKSEGTDELYEMLRGRPASEIEEVCRTFPIETLRLDWDSIKSDFRNSKRFELITVLAQILVRYEKILDQSPERRLPKSLPAKQLADTLMSRLMSFISSQQNVEVAHGLRIRLHDFAMALMQAGRDRDALTCLLASQPSLKEDHDFWICACRFNIAQTTENPDDISAAIDAAEWIVSGKVKVPEKYAQGARQMLSKLKELRRNGRSEPKQVSTAGNDLEREVLKMLEESLGQHLSRLKRNYATTKGFHAMKTLWEKLVRPDILAFATSVIVQEFRKSLADHLHHYQARRFGDIYLAVSTIPALDPDEARAYFGCGYSGFVDVLLNECGYGVGDSHLAHWIFCCDGRQQAVHLSFMPAMKMIETQGPNTISVLAQDLMTLAERAQAGIV